MTSSPPDGERDESLEDIRMDEESATRPAELYYPNVAEFVADRFIYFVPRPTPESGRVWCPSWFRHAQALSRLDSMWRAWETLRWDGALGMSNWWLHHVDPHLSALLDPVTGPFAGCADGHRTSEPLPIEQVPDGLFAPHATPSAKDPFSLD
ncbi:DUF4913 domain-containing protein [Streptomyces sp. NPDC001939]|uniref:DUF4913 domain-containing protein n=1 Tax=unclassified Streptomyces TaxID=2593676 RepID=UPI002257B992|nr:DUF4913 domain-containing protein [Streptomyces sp. NBC_00401]MCX5079431.1 DUF4913 domain-containing protein [Streptomyces sp. NBC_00401]